MDIEVSMKRSRRCIPVDERAVVLILVSHFTDFEIFEFDQAPFNLSIRILSNCTVRTWKGAEDRNFRWALVALLKLSLSIPAHFRSNQQAIKALNLRM